MVVAAEPPPAPLDHRVPDRRILVVDDVVDAGRSLARMLELVEYHVWVVHDGPSALEAVDRLHPHVVFLDIGMPEMDGLEVGRRLRARFGRDAMLLVATTGFGRDEDRRRTGEAGFDGHLVKPIDPTAVQALLSGIGGVSYPNRNARSARHGP
jgi:CheY-like chemotaxis protein